MFLLQGSLRGTEHNTGCDLCNACKKSQPCKVFCGLANTAALHDLFRFLRSKLWTHDVKFKQICLPLNVTLFLHPVEMTVFRLSDTVVPLNSLWYWLQLRKNCWVVETSKHCVSVCVRCASDVCVTAEEAVGQQGRGIMTAPLVALLGLYRGPLINLAPAWPLALLYLWPSTHRCAHTLYWQTLLIQGQTHTCTRIQMHYACIHTLKGTCMHADIGGIMNMHVHFHGNYHVQI